MSGQHRENYDVKQETVHCYLEMLTTVASQRGFQILLLFCFVV